MSNVIFSPPPGLYTDDTSFTDKGRWIDGSNVRPWEGQMQVIGGWLRRISTQITGSTYKSDIREWKSNNGTSYVAYGPPANLKIETGATLYDVTPTGTFANSQWVFQNWGETLLANVSGAKLYQWSLNTGTPAAEITQSPDNITCILVTPERQCLALGCNEEVSTTFNSRCIRGCDLEDLTDWTTTATNNAFEHILDGATSGIVTGRMVGSVVAVWTETELFVGQFIGDPSQTYRFDRIGSNCGAIGRRAVQVVGSTVYWLAPNLEFWAWTPGAEPTVLKCPIINGFRADVETANKANIFASHVAAFNEVWFTYPQSSGAYLGRFVALNVNSALWFKGVTKRRAMVQGLSSVIAVDNGGNLINCEVGRYGDSATNGTLEWSLESASYYLDKANRRVMLRGVWPDFGNDRSGNVSMVLKTREYPVQVDEVFQTAITLAQLTTKKNFRASGRIYQVALSGTDSGTNTATYMRFGSLVFDGVPTGMR